MQCSLKSNPGSPVPRPLVPSFTSVWRRHDAMLLSPSSNVGCSRALDGSRFDRIFKKQVIFAFAVRGFTHVSDVDLGRFTSSTEIQKGIGSGSSDGKERILMSLLFLIPEMWR